MNILNMWVIQITSLFFTNARMFTLASPYNCWLEHKHHVWFIIIIYATIFFFSNFGPNSTTFIVPIEIYLARFRSTLRGFCVACNKIDAIVVGAFICNYIAQSKMTLSLAGPNPRYLPGIGLRNTVFIVLSLNFLGLVLTVGETRMGTLPMSLTWGCKKNVEHP